jgi:hypothetical protein
MRWEVYDKRGWDEKYMIKEDGMRSILLIDDFNILYKRK